MRPEHEIAVLPFTNASGDLEQDYFSTGLTEDIITRLRQYKGKAVDVREVGRDLVEPPATD